MHLLVMAKEPRPGRVKTRLCPPCTPEEAAELAAAAIADTLAAVAACGADRRVIALDGEPGPWLPEGFEVVPQVDGPLGRRLDAAWAAVDGPGVQIGMDTPQVDGPLLDVALGLLADGAPCVLGDATDGGWWAIGLQRAVPDLFAPVPTSRDDTGALQRERCRELGLEVTDLPALTDVDHVDDALEVARAAPDGRFGRTVAALDLGGRATPDGPR
jgi:uncharacterized protein